MYRFWRKSIPGKREKNILHICINNCSQLPIKVSCFERDTFAFGFHGVSEFNIRYLNRVPAVRKSQSLISKWNFDSNTAIPL